MKVIAYGDIMDGGSSVFTSAAKVDGPKLLVSFDGVIRIDNPYNHLRPYLDELNSILSAYAVEETLLDFTKLRFCNSNGFYIIMDITEVIYEHTSGPVLVLRLQEDDWQQETLPILIDIDDPAILGRTAFEDRTEF
jgi:hypothetical protein